MATEFAFEPRELTLEAGTAYNILLDNRGALVHDLTIPAIGFRLVAQPGEQTSAGLLVAERGAYEFWCSISGHAEAGMTGVLTGR